MNHVGIPIKRLFSASGTEPWLLALVLMCYPLHSPVKLKTHIKTSPVGCQMVWPDSEIDSTLAGREGKWDSSSSSGNKRNGDVKREKNTEKINIEKEKLTDGRGKLRKRGVKNKNN